MYGLLYRERAILIFCRKVEVVFYRLGLLVCSLVKRGRKLCPSWKMSGAGALVSYTACSVPRALQPGRLCDMSSKRTAVGRGLEVMLLSTSDLFKWWNSIFSFLERRVFLPTNPRIKATCPEKLHSVGQALSPQVTLSVGMYFSKFCCGICENSAL